MTLARIEKSAFRRGEYVGYAGGVWLIRKSTSSYGRWAATHRDDKLKPTLYACTLASLDAQLAQRAYRNSRKG